MKTRAQIVERAREHVGHRETAPNDSPLIREWLKRCGIGKPAAWCAAFASWCVFDRPSPPNSGRIVEIVQPGALKLGGLFPETREPQPGDLMFFATDDEGHGHVGVVVDVLPTLVLCIEGNSENRVRYVVRRRDEVRFACTRPAEHWEGGGVGTLKLWDTAPLVRVSKAGTR